MKQQQLSYTFSATTQHYIPEKDRLAETLLYSNKYQRTWNIKLILCSAVCSNFFTYFAPPCTRPKSLICIFFSSPQPFGKLTQSWTDVLGETLAFWWVLLGLTRVVKKKTQFGDIYVVLHLELPQTKFPWNFSNLVFSSGFGFIPRRSTPKYPLTFLASGSFYYTPV